MVPAIQPSQQAVQSPQGRPDRVVGTAAIAITAPQHFLYFFPLPQLQGSFLPVVMMTASFLESCNVFLYMEHESA
jgi:hypothetical protein